MAQCVNFPWSFRGAFFFFKETVVSGSGTKMWKAGLCYEFGLFVAQSPHLGHQLSPIET